MWQEVGNECLSQQFITANLNINKICEIQIDYYAYEMKTLQQYKPNCELSQLQDLTQSNILKPNKNPLLITCELCCYKCYILTVVAIKHVITKHRSFRV